MSRHCSVILFGMPRASEPFVESVTRALLEPLSAAGLTCRVTGLLNLPDRVENPRSGESGRIQDARHLTELFPDVTLRAQDETAISDDFRFFSGFSDRWNDGYNSLRNMLHQQRSLRAAWEATANDPAALYIFLRPDLVYLDSLKDAATSVLQADKPLISTPAWLTCRGLNDRIAITNARPIAEAYATRMSLAQPFVREYAKGLHAERLLAYAIGTGRIRHSFFAARAARCRIDGKVVAEDFTIKWRVKARTQARLRLAPKTFAA